MRGNQRRPEVLRVLHDRWYRSVCRLDLKKRTGLACLFLPELLDTARLAGLQRTSLPQLCTGHVTPCCLHSHLWNPNIKYAKFKLVLMGFGYIFLKVLCHSLYMCSCRLFYRMTIWVRIRVLKKSKQNAVKLKNELLLNVFLCLNTNHG